jgi:hypothetical protein
MFARLLRGLAGSSLSGAARPFAQNMGPIGAALTQQSPFGQDSQRQMPGPIGQAAMQDSRPGSQQPAMQFLERPIEPLQSSSQMMQQEDRQPLGNMQMGQDQPLSMSDQGQDAMGQIAEQFGQRQMGFDPDQDMIQMGQTPLQESPPARYFATPDANPSRPPQPSQAGSDDIGLPTSDPSYQYQMQGGVEAYAPQFSYRYRRR